MADIGFYGDGGGNNPYDIGAMGGAVNYTDPTPRSADPSQGDPYGTVSGYYQSLLGRAPENQDVVKSWVNGLGGGGSNLAAVYSAIGASPEAQAFKTRAAAPAQPAAPSGFQMGGNLRDPGYASQFVSYYANQPGANQSLTRDPNYWIGKITSGELGSDPNYIISKFMLPEGAPAGGAPSGVPYAATGGNPGGYTDASSQLYLDQVLQRLQQVQQPQDNSIFELLKSLATQQATKLQQAPYTPADDAALITQYRQPLTQARDTAKQQAALEMSRRGITPTSGVYQDRMKAIDVAYQGGVAQGANQMGVNAVQLKNQNAMQALQILSSLSSANNTQIDRSNAMQDQAVNLAQMFPNFDAQRLNQLLQASGDSSSSSALQSLMSLGNMNLNTIGMNNTNDAANSAAWGKLIAGLLGAI